MNAASAPRGRSESPSSLPSARVAGEFDIIARYFKRPVRQVAQRVHLGIGDDCALIGLAPGLEMAVSTDMLVSGTHFFPDTDPERLGHKTLAVNLSDLAAMGAQPRCATLALAMPAANEAWIEAFARGFFRLAAEQDVDLIGGDTTRGPLTLCVTVFGELPQGTAIRRDGAGEGDDIWVSGCLGSAALGLAHLKGELALSAQEVLDAVRSLEQPAPRVALGSALRGIATAMLDVSDGLVGDLAHIALASGLDAVLNRDAVPMVRMVARQVEAVRWGCALAGGDDYELCFTAPPDRHADVLDAGHAAQVQVTRIGRMEAARSATGAVLVVDSDGKPCAPTVLAYDHFRTAP